MIGSTFDAFIAGIKEAITDIKIENMLINKIVLKSKLVGILLKK